MQIAQCDKKHAIINVNVQSVGPSSLYPTSVNIICQNRIEPSKPDARLKESAGLSNEQQTSADFNNLFSNPIILDPPLVPALPARMVARMSKLPHAATLIDPNITKKTKNVCHR